MQGVKVTPEKRCLATGAKVGDAVNGEKLGRGDERTNHARSDPSMSRSTVPVSGGEEQQVHDLPPIGYWGYWGIGSQGLYLVNPEAKPRPAIEFFNLATLRLARIAELERQPVQWTGGFSVSRDERSILYGAWEQGGSDIMMVEGFR